MTLAKPSLGLLRSLTDEHVLNELVAAGRLTRAELAARTGISKPTIAESVRRLTEDGLLQDTGERSTGRGRAGSYFALADGLGSALAVDVTASAITIERLELSGATLARAVEEVPADPEPDAVAAALARAAERAIGDTGAARLAVVSAADPVDRRTGRLVELPDSPFLVGELDPPTVLGPYVSGPVTVDNDVHWAARAELEGGGPADFVYLYLGAGLGGAIVSDGEVRRGGGGIAGEVSHVITAGPDGRAMPFTEVFERLGLHRPGSSAIDVPGLLRRLSGPGAGSEAGVRKAQSNTFPEPVEGRGPVRLGTSTGSVRGGRRSRTGSADEDADAGTALDGTIDAIAAAVCGVLVTIVSLTDPELIIVGGSWGTDERLLDAVAARLQDQPRRTAVRAATAAADAPLTAVREFALAALRREVLARS